MDGTSLTPEQVKLNAIREILPEAFSEGKIDWEKLKATLGEDINFANERYVLNWAGKSDAFKVLQKPSSKTLIPDKEESVNFDQTENIFIEGENMEVLKVLQKSYFGKVKMIYIDPPYNTGNDSFIYPDKFSETKADYEKRVGDKDEEGYMTKDGMFKKNSKENGQYHSNWLNMMMPRLYLAKNLLRQDGVIFVSIDDNEVHNLRLLMNEIFGEENFAGNIVWQKKYGPANDATTISDTHESILCFAKNIEYWTPYLLSRNKEQLKAFQNPDNDPRGKWRASDFSARTYSLKCDYSITIPSGKTVNPPASRSWISSKERFEELVKDNRIWFGIDGNGRPMQKKFLTEIRDGITPQTWWDRSFAGDNKTARYEMKKIFPENVFETPKPSSLIKRIIEISCKENIILDFFAGSATTAHAVMDLNKEDGGARKYICVQLPELCDEKSEAYKAGYKTIAEISKERIRRAGKKINEEIKTEIGKLELEIEKFQGELPTEETKAEIENIKIKIEQLKAQDLGFKVLKLEDSNFKQWQQIEGKDAKALAEQMELFVDPVSENATIENMVYELLLKSGKDLNSKIFPSFGGVVEDRGGNSRNSKNYFELPFNPKLKERAKELRQAGNLSEVLFWNQVKNKQFKGFDFDRQKIVGNYIVDFYCSNCQVVIEIDGSSHDEKAEYDAERDAFLENLGLTVIHIPVAEVMNNMSGVMQILFNHPALKGTPPKEGNSMPNYYIINDTEMILLLEKATQEIIDAVIAEKPIKVIALDKLFKGNDPLKTNTVLQMKDLGIEFKTI